MSRKEPRQLKELRNLMPWTWDARKEKHPPGPPYKIIGLEKTLIIFSKDITGLKSNSSDVVHKEYKKSAVSQTLALQSAGAASMRDFEDCLQFSFKQRSQRHLDVTQSASRKRRKKVCACPLLHKVSASSHRKYLTSFQWTRWLMDNMQVVGDSKVEAAEGENVTELPTTTEMV